MAMASSSADHSGAGSGWLLSVRREPFNFGVVPHSPFAKMDPGVSDLPSSMLLLLQMAKNKLGELSNPALGTPLSTFGSQCTALWRHVLPKKVLGGPVFNV